MNPAEMMSDEDDGDEKFEFRPTFPLFWWKNLPFGYLNEAV